MSIILYRSPYMLVKSKLHFIKDAERAHLLTELSLTVYTPYSEVRTVLMVQCHQTQTQEKAQERRFDVIVACEASILN